MAMLKVDSTGSESEQAFREACRAEVHENRSTFATQPTENKPFLSESNL